MGDDEEILYRVICAKAVLSASCADIICYLLYSLSGFLHSQLNLRGLWLDSRCGTGTQQVVLEDIPLAEWLPK